jgi:hypothetical protein
MPSRERRYPVKLAILCTVLAASVVACGPRPSSEAAVVTRPPVAEPERFRGEPTGSPGPGGQLAVAPPAASPTSGPCAALSIHVEYDRESDNGTGAATNRQARVTRFADDWLAAWNAWDRNSPLDFAPAARRADEVTGTALPSTGPTNRGGTSTETEEGSLAYYFDERGRTVEVLWDPVADSSDYSFLYAYECPEAPASAGPGGPPSAAEVVGLLEVSPLLIETTPPGTVAEHLHAHRDVLGDEPRVTCESGGDGSWHCSLWTSAGYFYAARIVRGLAIVGSTLMAQGAWQVTEVELLADD